MTPKREGCTAVMGVNVPAGKTGATAGGGGVTGAGAVGLLATGAGVSPALLPVGAAATTASWAGALPVVAQPASQTAIAIRQADAIFMEGGRDDSG